MYFSDDSLLSKIRLPFIIKFPPGARFAYSLFVHSGLRMQHALLQGDRSGLPGKHTTPMI